jgi:hypothetical protein
MFFLLPFFHLAVFAGMGLAAAWAVTWLLGLSGWIGTLVFIAVAIAGFIGGLYWPGKKWHTQHILVDWIFSRDFARDRRPDMNERLQLFSKRIAEMKSSSSGIASARDLPRTYSRARSISIRC